MSQTEKYTNALIHETSPYLLQHAHNPVNWMAWNKETLQKAKDENKIILISIGYSACHWCHVMEHESFEDDSVAKVMNENFVCIKVDREERPDIDQVYMHAVQLMTGQGGWPLNCFALPDGRPLYGGTYFPKLQWINILSQVAELWKKEPGRCAMYAADLTKGIKEADLVKTVDKDDQDFYTIKDVEDAYNKWSGSFDLIEGGPNRAPKFPLPNNYEFLLRYYYHTDNTECLNQVLLTLNKMAYGGIYDHVGGGFARYSTDSIWKVPHFEKMLYDNAQLITLYSQAYQLTKNELFKKVVYETIEFIEREMTSSQGGFYSALDADSEGEEGKFYVWKKENLENLLKEKSKIFFETYNINDFGYWEHDNYILIRKENDQTIARKNNMSVEQLTIAINECKIILLEERNKRIRPGLDDKILTSWNALMIKAYADAYDVFGEQKFLNAAIKHADFILLKLYSKHKGLYHNYKAGRSTINGFLEDYCFTIEAFIALYQSTFDEKWLLQADELMKFSVQHFQDKSSGMFYFTSDTDSSLITRKIETEDNVIPASNSSIAKSLFLLGHYFENEEYLSISKKMLLSVKDYFIKYPASFSNWGLLILDYLHPFHEIGMAGINAPEKRNELNKYFIPNKLIAGSNAESKMPLLRNRYIENKTLIYVCIDKHCLLPTEKTEDAVKQIKK